MRPLWIHDMHFIGFICRFHVEPGSFLGENNWLVPAVWLQPLIKQHRYRKGQMSCHRWRWSKESLDVLICEWKLCRMEQCMLLPIVRVLLRTQATLRPLPGSTQIYETFHNKLITSPCRRWSSETRLANRINLIKKSHYLRTTWQEACHNTGP